VKNIVKKLQHFGKRIFHLFKRTRRGNDIYTLVREVKRKHGIPRKSPREIIEDLYIPSIQSFFFIAAIVLLFLLLSLWPSTKIPSESNSYQNLITVLVGISTMIFALAIFIAGSSHEAKDVDKMRVLLKQSYLFPLVVATILTFIILMFGCANLFTEILIALIGIGTICSVFNVIRTLLSRSLFLQKTAEVLSDRLKLMIDKEIDERLGNNILLSNLKSKVKLVFNPFIEKDNSKYYILTSEKSGLITNIRLDKLKEIGERVEEEANKNNYAFEKNAIKKVNKNNYASEENVIKKENRNIMNKIKEPANKRKLNPNKSRYLLTGFMWSIEKGDALILIDKSLIGDKKVMNKLKELVRESFVIKNNAKDPSEEIEKEVKGLGREFVKAIREKELSTLKDLEKIYITLVETFWEYVLKFGAYSYEEAHKERYSLLGKWKVLEWISNDYGRFLEETIDTGDKSIINNVYYLSIDIICRAVDHKDQLVFQEFLEFNELLYIYVLNTWDEKLKQFMIDHSRWYLKKLLADSLLAPKLENSSSNKQDLETYKDFAIYLFYLFQKLLKRSFDEEDFKSFKQFYDTTLNLFSLTEGLIPEDISNEISAKKKQMLFGVASWIFDKFSQNKDSLLFKKFYDTIRDAFSEDIEEFTETFIKCSTSSIDYWGWDLWEMEESKEGEVHSIQFPAKLSKFFVVNSLSILSTKTDEEIIRIELPYNREFTTLIDDKNSDLNRFLADISSNPHKWKFILSDDAISKIPLFRKLLEKAKETQKERDSEEKRQKQISEKKVEEFKKEVVEAFYEQATLRKIFKYYNLYQDKTNEIIEGERDKFGFFNLIDDKAAFFDKWYVHYLHWGKNYGCDLASIETSFLVDKIIENCTEIKNTEFDEILKKFTNPDDIIILAVNMAEAWEFLNGNKNFVSKRHRNRKEYKGILPKTDMKEESGWYKFQGKFIPIFEVFHNKGRGSIIILDKSKLGWLVQYSPIDKENNKKLIKDIFYMDVQDLSSNEKKMEEIIEKKPKWLIKKGDEEEQKKYLQECVIVNIYESFEYQKSKDFNGYVLNFH